MEHIPIIYLRRALCLLLLAWKMLSAAWAGEPVDLPESALSLHGFGTLGLAHSSSDQADFVRDLSQPGGARGGWSGKVDSVLGLQLNYRLTEQTEAVAQVVSRYRYDESFRPEVHWAFLKHDLYPDLSLRVGRVGIEFYMLADSRLVTYSYLPVRLPPDYFSTLPVYYMDGGDAMLTVPVAQGLATFKVYYGLAGEKIPIGGWNWDFSGSNIFGTRVDYRQNAWQWRLSYSQLRFQNDFPVNTVRGALRSTGLPGAVAAADAFVVGGKRAHFYSAGATYDKGPLQAQLMFSRTTHESAIFENSVAAYGLLAYRFSSATPYVGFSRARSGRKNVTTGLPGTLPSFAVLNEHVAGIMRQSHVDQHTFFAGLRWDIRPDVAVKIQWDALRGKPESTAFVQSETPAWNGRTNVLSLSLDFVF